MFRLLGLLHEFEVLERILAVLFVCTMPLMIVFKDLLLDDPHVHVSAVAFTNFSIVYSRHCDGSVERWRFAICRASGRSGGAFLVSPSPANPFSLFRRVRAIVLFWFLLDRGQAPALAIITRARSGICVCVW